MVHHYKQIVVIIGVLAIFVSESSSNDFKKDLRSSHGINVLPKTTKNWHPSSFCRNVNASFCILNKVQLNIVFNNYNSTEASPVANSSQPLTYIGYQCRIQHFMKSIFTKTQHIFQFLRKLYELIMRPEKLFETPFKQEIKTIDLKHERKAIAFKVLNQIIYFGFYLIFIVCKH